MFFNKLVNTLAHSAGWRRQGIAFICGALTSFALTPFDITPISFFTFPILVFFLDGIATIENRRKRYQLAALTCWSFGFGYFVFGLWWLSNSMLIDPITFGWAIPFAIFGLPAYLALFWAFAGLIACFLWSKDIRRFFALAFALGVGEYLRGNVLTGFPWNSIGYSAMPTPIFMQSAAIFGLYGINALAVLLYSLPTVFLTREKKQTAITFLCLLIALDIGFGFYRLSGLPAPDIAQKDALWVRIIQPSIPLTEKLDNDSRLANFERHINLSIAPPKFDHPTPSFIVWPETSVPYILSYAPAAQLKIASILKPQQWAIVGTVRVNEASSPKDRLYYNSMEVIDGNGDIVSASNKVHLVPFGEYLPYQSLFDKIGLHAIAQTTGGYTPETLRKSVTLPNGFTYLPLICYEIIFPNEMTYSGQKPQAIINITNDAWFGVTPGPYQHLQQAKIRAVEQGLPVIRAANNGISAVIDPYGRVVTSSRQNEIVFVDAPIPQPIAPIWNKNIELYQTFILFALLFMVSINIKGTILPQSIDKS